jgi:hypothetical protein
MLSFTELLKAIDKFYTLAQKTSSVVKRAALQVKSPVYDKVSDEIFDSLANEDFAELFENYLKAYENFVNSLNINPQEFGRILTGGETEGDNFVDLLVPFNEAYEELTQSPYLQQGLQDEGWEEGSTPEEIRNGIEALATDANNRMYALAKIAHNWTPQDVRDFLAGRSNEFQDQLEGKGSPGANEGMSATEQEFRNRKIQQSKDYNRSHRTRRSAALTVGRSELERQLNDLQSRIDSETNGIKKEELSRQLRDRMSSLRLVKSYEERQAKEKLKLQNDPVAYKKYTESNTKRQQSTRDFNQKFYELINRFNTATSPNDQARIKLELVRLKKELMQKNFPSMDFDSDEVKYNPKIQAELNPETIIKTYEKRKGQVKQHINTQLGARQKDKAIGNLTGLIQNFSEALASEKPEVKRRLNDMFKDYPEIQPFKAKIAAAKKAKDNVAFKAAAAELNNFLTGDKYQTIKINSPMFKLAAQMEADMRAWIYDLKTVVQSRGKGLESLTEADLPIIQQLIADGRDIVAKYTSNGPLNQKAQYIVQFLEDRI